MQGWIEAKWGRWVTWKRARATQRFVHLTVAVSAWRWNVLIFVFLMHRHLQTLLDHRSTAVEDKLPRDIEWVNHTPFYSCSLLVSVRTSLLSFAIEKVYVGYRERKGDCAGYLTTGLSVTRRPGIETLAVFNITTQPPSTQQRRTLPCNVHVGTLKEQIPHSLHRVSEVWRTHGIWSAL